MGIGINSNQNVANIGIPPLFYKDWNFDLVPSNIEILAHFL